jgi:uncharacterized protein (TIGR03118 family)
MKPLSYAAVTAALGLFACAGNVNPQEPADPPADTQAVQLTPARVAHFNALKSSKVAVQITRTDLVSDQPGALHQDPTLVNAWGIAFNPSGVAWISANGNGVAALYDAKGGPVAQPITVPGLGDTSAPTGQAFNEDTAAFRGDHFIVVTEDGTIAGWAGGASFETRVDASGRNAVFKGLALSSFQGTRRLYAADFRNGTVDVFDDQYNPIKTQGGFLDVDIPTGFAPFNVAASRGTLIVTYAMQDDMKHDDVKGVGNGFVDMFDGDGVLLARLATRGALNSPWGVAVAPWDLGGLSQRLLIGNFGDGRINIFRVDNPDGPPTPTFEGQLNMGAGQPITIDGLWALSFGVGAGGFDTHALYFTAGPGGEMHGLFGVLQFQTTLTTLMGKP